MKDRLRLFATYYLYWIVFFVLQKQFAEGITGSVK